jgi:1-acyl-sn-glycerol-3-phosphate acyltransferase
MLYALLKVIVGFTLRIFYRKIYINGTEFIKDGRPQLIASNHPNGFMEPLVMACFFDKPLHFLVRGDVFDKKWLKPLLVATNQIPIFRFRDGFSKLRENSATMDESTKVLLANNTLLIYAEGSTSGQRTLRPLQKGLARIAFTVLEADHDTKLEILPAGVFFTHPTQFGEEVHLSIGQPIRVQDYKDLYEADPKSAYAKILQDIYDAMLNHVVHLDDVGNTPLLEKIMYLGQMHKTDPYLPISVRSREKLDKYMDYADRINKANINVVEVETKMSVLELELSKQKYSLQDLRKKPLRLGSLLILIFGFLPAILGMITNSLPIWAGKTFAKNKVTQSEFFACIWMSVTIVFFLIYYGVVIFIIHLNNFPWYILPIMILCGLWSRYYYDVVNQYNLFTKPSKWRKYQAEGSEIIS